MSPEKSAKLLIGTICHDGYRPWHCGEFVGWHGRYARIKTPIGIKFVPRERLYKTHGRLVKPLQLMLTAAWEDRWYTPR